MLPPYTGNPWWTLGTSATTVPDVFYWWGGNQLATTTPLGIYNMLVAQSATNVWINVANQTMPSLAVTSVMDATNRQLYAALYQQAIDMPMPSATERVYAVARHSGLMTPAIIRAGRRAVRRSIDLYLRVRPAEELRAFLQGTPIVIHGARLRYRMRKSGGVMRQTISPSHGIPFRMEMLALHSDDPIASGCVFLERTPMLDQLLAFIMHVTDPEGERELVARTNWSPRLPPVIGRRLTLSPLEADPLAQELANAA